ncbi:MAG TPA: hypothetical protein VGP88_04660 [Thermoplasmata archaeon]|nr:hypothetical protein [Thermoplasmata archaeon]
MAAEQHSSSPSAAPTSPMGHGSLIIAIAVIVVAALIVVGLGFANVIPGFHLGANGAPGTSPPAKFAVEFSETGLASGTSWSVVLAGATGTSTNATLTFQESPGTYAYTVGMLRGYVATPASGTVVVSGGAASVTVTFKAPGPASQYAVTFSETGLPASTSWQVTLNGTAQTGTGADISFSVPNGTYDYSVGPVNGYTATPPAGSVTMAGSAKDVDIAFTGATATTYSLTFNETGLPPDTAWSVTVNGTLLSGTARSLGLVEPNGSYPYSVGSVASYSPTPSSGTVHVNGRAASVTIAFSSGSSPPTNASFALSFDQSGVPSNVSWSVYFGNNDSLGAMTEAEGSTQTVDVENGTYGWFAYTYYFNASQPLGTYYAASPNNGTVNVSGAAQSVRIDFVAIAPTTTSTTTYPVNVTETGLPHGAEWWLYAGSANGSAASGSSIELFLPNGTWSYNATTNATGYANIGSFGGSFTVNGGPTTAVVPFVPITTLVFNITGGIGFSPWQISISQNGSEYYSEAGDIGNNFTLRVPDGLVAWNASALTYQLTPSSGSFTAAGTTVTTQITATADSNYAVTINETGVSGGPFWVPSIWAWNGASYSGFTEYVGGAFTYTFQLPNGTYFWSATTPSGSYIADPASGVVVVRGGPTTVYTNFTALPSDAMDVLFEESTFSYGLAPEIPAGASWSVTFNGATQTTSGPFLVFVAPNGTYHYTVTAPSGYQPLPMGGNVTIDGNPALGGDEVIVNVDFSAGLMPWSATTGPAHFLTAPPIARWA